MAAKATYTPVGENVAKARLAIADERGRSMSQQDLADRCGIHRVTVARIERGSTRVSLDVLERLCEVLGRSREYLLGEPEPVDDFELARAKMSVVLESFSEAVESFSDAVDLLQRAARDAAREGQVA